jgi:hypothetical protein
MDILSSHGHEVFIAVAQKYSKFIKKPDTNILFFQISRGAIQGSLHSSGFIIPRRLFTVLEQRQSCYKK